MAERCFLTVTEYKQQQQNQEMESMHIGRRQQICLHVRSDCMYACCAHRRSVTCLMSCFQSRPVDAPPPPPLPWPTQRWVRP